MGLFKFLSKDDDMEYRRDVPEDVRQSVHRMLDKVLDIEDVLDLDIVDTSDNLYKLISNGVKIDYKSNKDFILFRYKGEDISLYQKECDKYSMFISIKA